VRVSPCVKTHSGRGGAPRAAARGSHCAQQGTTQDRSFHRVVLVRLRPGFARHKQPLSVLSRNADRLLSAVMFLQHTLTATAVADGLNELLTNSRFAHLSRHCFFRLDPKSWRRVVLCSYTEQAANVSSLLRASGGTKARVPLLVRTFAYLCAFCVSQEAASAVELFCKVGTKFLLTLDHSLPW
jgi:hypothetical protein